VDARVVEQVANANAHGLEQHIAPCMHESRRDVVRAVIEAQDPLPVSHDLGGNLCDFGTSSTALGPNHG